MAEIAAAIDIGTNSVKLTVGRLDSQGRLEVLLDTTEITRLGKGVDASGRLNDEAVHRTLASLASFGQDARNLGATRIAAVGTSALRDAANGGEFVRDAQRDLGGSVEVISGDREAQLTYQAARHDPDLGIPANGDASLTTIDLGGGSMEVVIGHANAVTYRDSLQLGAVRITERALSSDPPTAAERRDAERIVDDVLKAIPATGGGKSSLVVGSGGTIANLAAMQAAGRDSGAKPTSESIHGTKLTLSAIESQIDSLSAVALAERRKTPGIEPDRADVIIAGAIILARTLRHLGSEEALVSARGLRFGLLYELLEEPTSE